MARRPNISELVELSVDERLRLVEDLWDSIASVPDNVRLTDAQKRELDRTLDEYGRSAERLSNQPKSVETAQVEIGAASQFTSPAQWPTRWRASRCG
ncbi:MAG: addiction module protein [Phycisphaerae bacterium]